MKKALALVITIVILSGCKKKEAVVAPLNPSVQIIGLWTQSTSQNIYYVHQAEVYRDGTASDTQINSYEEFKKDGTFTEYQRNDQTGSFVSKGTVAYTLNNITLHFNNLPDYTIGFLNNDRFILTQTHTGQINYSSGGEPHVADSVIYNASYVRLTTAPN